MKKIYVLFFIVILIISFTGGYFLNQWRTSNASKNISNNGNSIDNKPTENNSGSNNTTTNNGSVKETDPIKLQISQMSTDEKIGQLVMVGVDGYKFDENSRKMLEDNHVGGFIILGQNVQNSDQLMKLTNSLKTANSKSNIPLFISIDQEGGRIDRMPSEIKKFPTNKAIGGKNSEKLSYSIGTVLAYEIKSFGFNMDFAPVLDINSNVKNPVIGDRSFGSNASIVSKLGVETMKGIKSGNVIPVIKHFPGHGDTAVDSHIGLPLVNNDINRLNSFELIPFAEAIKNDADVVMIAHILLPKIDAENPASFSKVIITNILREQLNYKGVVITDDMTMGAILKNYDIGTAAVKSINAGSDIILVAHEFSRETAVINALKKAVQDGTISAARIDDSVYRILKLKNKYGLSDKTIETVDVASINKKISSVLNPYFK